MKIAALASFLGAGMVASATSADIVHFVNPAPGQPGNYEWACPLTYDTFSWLDITRSAADQQGAASGSGVSQYASSLFTSPPNRTNFHRQEMDIGAMVLAVTTSFGNTTNFLSVGTLIGPAPDGAHWAGATFHGLPMLFTEHRFIGVQTTSGHHGWIEVSRAGLSLTAHAWAYQTEPGVPIVAGQIPAPASLALCGLGACMTMRRRRS